MPRLFYKDLKAHEKAYRDVRADEAVNDLILGSKVNKLRNFETAREKAIDQVAKNYGDFLKALKVKNVELVNRANNAEKLLDETLTQVANPDVKKIAKDIGTSVLMPGKRARSNTISSEAPTVPEEIEEKESYYTIKKRLIDKAESNIRNNTKATSVRKTIINTLKTDQNTQRSSHLIETFNSEVKSLLGKSKSKAPTIDILKQALKNMRA